MQRQLQQISEPNWEMEVFIHDLASPISSMDLCLNLLKKQISSQRLYQRAPKNEEIEETITRAVSSLEQLNYIIEHGRGNHLLPKYTEEIDIFNEIENVRTRYVAQLERYKILFEFNCDEGSTIQANKYRFIQVLDNLVKNSVEALQRCPQKKKKITITVKQEKRSIQIIIHDNGCGMNAGVIHEVFGLNYSTKPGHSGVGLWLVRQIVSGELKGYIHVRSEVDKYTEIVLALPLRQKGK